MNWGVKQHKLYLTLFIQLYFLVQECVLSINNNAEICSSPSCNPSLSSVREENKKEVGSLLVRRKRVGAPVVIPPVLPPVVPFVPINVVGGGSGGSSGTSYGNPTFFSGGQSAIGSAQPSAVQAPQPSFNQQPAVPFQQPSVSQASSFQSSVQQQPSIQPSFQQQSFQQPSFQQQSFQQPSFQQQSFQQPSFQQQSFQQPTFQQNQFFQQSVPQELNDYPLPECYTNDGGLMSCSMQVEERMRWVVQRTLRRSQAQMAEAIQLELERCFNTTFEVIVAMNDFASKSHFHGNFITKLRAESRVLLAYATPKTELEHQARIGPRRWNGFLSSLHRTYQWK